MQKIITDRKEAAAAGILKAGLYFEKADNRQKMYLPIWYGNKLDLESMTVYTPADNLDSIPFPDLNELVKDGLVLEKKAYRVHDIFLAAYSNRFTKRELTDERVDKIVREFKDHGFNVTKKAIRHNYEAWLSDFKSGYRDERRGYHLFTPCGCNPLSFRVSSLFEESDWQVTYAG